MQQATLAQSVEQRIRNAQVVSSSLMSGSKKGSTYGTSLFLSMFFPFLSHSRDIIAKYLIINKLQNSILQFEIAGYHNSLIINQ